MFLSEDYPMWWWSEGKGVWIYYIERHWKPRMEYPLNCSVLFCLSWAQHPHSRMKMSWVKWSTRQITNSEYGLVSMPAFSLHRELDWTARFASKGRRDHVCLLGDRQNTKGIEHSPKQKRKRQSITRKKSVFRKQAVNRVVYAVYKVYSVVYFVLRSKMHRDVIHHSLVIKWRSSGYIAFPPLPHTEKTNRYVMHPIAEFSRRILEMQVRLGWVCDASIDWDYYSCMNACMYAGHGTDSILVVIFSIIMLASFAYICTLLEVRARVWCEELSSMLRVFSQPPHHLPSCSRLLLKIVMSWYWHSCAGK